MTPLLLSFDEKARQVVLQHDWSDFLFRSVVLFAAASLASGLFLLFVARLLRKPNSVAVHFGIAANIFLFAWMWESGTDGRVAAVILSFPFLCLIIEEWKFFAERKRLAT